jgi:predicted flap endonuclease-1-like 5' DNA nuclease
MWPLCTFSLSSALWLLGPFILGLLTAWWMSRGGVSEPEYAYAAPDPEPVAAPRPVQTFTAPVPEPVAAPVASPIPAVAAVAMTAIGIPAAVGNADDLLQIKGVGPKLNALLNGLGIHRFDQIANWGPDEIAKVDTHLDMFKGRIDRDQWIEQAGLLARGDIAAFEAKFGTLDSENQ